MFPAFFSSLVDAKRLLKWALRLASALLQSPFVNFEIKILDQSFAQRIAALIEDGKLTDEELGEMLARIADEL